MQKFIFNENSKITLLMKQLGVVMMKYNQKDLDTASALLHFLNNAIDTFKNLAQPDNQTWVEGLKTTFSTAYRGINPQTLEQPRLGKRTMQNNIYYKIMQDAEAQLKTMYQSNNEVLKQAEALLGQIIIAGFQTGLLTDEIIKNADLHNKIESIWQLLSTDENIQLGQKRVLLMINKYDTYILLGDMLNSEI